MPKEINKQLLYADCDDLINDEEFILLCDIDSSKNLDFEYWPYPKFGIEAKSNVISKLRFQRRNKLICYFCNNLRLESTEALCILLRQAYSCPYVDMSPLFGMALLTTKYDIQPNCELYLLNILGQLLLRNWGAALDNVCCFLDEIVCPFCRFKVQQRIIHNRNKYPCCENIIFFKSE